METVHTASWPLCLVYKYGEFFTSHSTKTETLHVQKHRAGNNEWVRKGRGVEGRERHSRQNKIFREKRSVCVFKLVCFLFDTNNLTNNIRTDFFEKRYLNNTLFLIGHIQRPNVLLLEGR